MPFLASQQIRQVLSTPPPATVASRMRRFAASFWLSYLFWHAQHSPRPLAQVVLDAEASWRGEVKLGAQVVRRDSDAQESFSTLDYREIAHRRQVLGADYPIRAWRGLRSVPREPIATTSR